MAETTTEKPKVLIARCDAYDPERIADITGQGMDELGAVPRGRTMVKPNIVIAHKTYFKDAYTRPEFIDGLLAAARKRGKEVTELSVGERCGITVPTRFVFGQAGYNPVIRKHGVKRYCFDECFQVERKFEHKDRLRDYIYVPQPIDECDFLINAPKLKSHPWTRITNALKNFIGIQDDRHRLVDHDYALETKIADLQEVIRQDFIAVDAIVAGELKMLTPKPFQLGIIIMGTNPTAVDTVACNIIGFDPTDVPHLLECHRRGYGPIEMDGIDLGGDLDLAEARKRAEKFRVPVAKVDEEFNNKSNIMAYVGPPPDPQGLDYCWGGCPGSLIEAVEVLGTMQPKVREEVRRQHYVFGAYQGEIAAKPGERVIFCGDCAAWEGKIGDLEVKEASRYVTREHKDPHKVTSRGLLARMIAFVWYVFRNRKKPVLRAKGCPVSVAENVLFLWKPGGTKNPYLDLKIVFPFMIAYVVFIFATVFRILFKKRPKKRYR